jgi:two-component system sensor histidine kinase TtrS
MIRLLLLLVIPLLYPALVLGEQINVMVIAISGADVAQKEWQPTIDYLNRQLPQHRFTLFPVIPSDMDKIRSLLTADKIDFVITQPAIYVDLERNFGATRILTMVKQGGYSEFGSTIIVRADSNIRNIQDLKGKVISGVAKLGFGGWLIGYNEMLENGFDPYTEAKEIWFMGTQTKQIQALLDKKVDAAVIRTGMLEKYVRQEALKLDQFRILAEKKYPDFNLKVSTGLYPEWAFARTHRASHQLSNSVALALLSMPPGGAEASRAGFQEWTFPYDYQPVHDLLKRLQVGPYKDYGKIDLWEAIKTHWLSVSIILFLVITILIVILVWNRKLEKEIISRKAVEEILRKNEEQLRLHAKVFQTSNEGIFITTPEPLIIAVNAGFSAITGYTEEEVKGQNPRYFSSGKHDKAFYQQMWSALIENGFWEGDIINRRKDGRLMFEWLRISKITDAHGVTTHYVALFSDITQKKASEEKLHRLAHFDPLTEIFNRHSFYDRLNQELNSAKRKELKFALLYLDLNDFKPINDKYGHIAGDYVLREIAQRCEHTIREIDIVARLGGDEFAFLLPDIQHDDEIDAISSRILNAVEKPVHYEGHTMVVRASIGQAVYPGDGQEAEKLIKHADQAMYREKADAVKD